MSMVLKRSRPWGRRWRHGTWRYNGGWQPTSTRDCLYRFQGHSELSPSWSRPLRGTGSTQGQYFRNPLTLISELKTANKFTLTDNVWLKQVLLVSWVCTVCPCCGGPIRTLSKEKACPASSERRINQSLRQCGMVFKVRSFSLKHLSMLAQCSHTLRLFQICFFRKFHFHIIVSNRFQWFSYLGMGFQLLRVDYTLRFWHSIAYVGHLVLPIFYLIGLVAVKPIMNITMPRIPSEWSHFIKSYRWQDNIHTIVSFESKITLPVLNEWGWNQNFDFFYFLFLKPQRSLRCKGVKISSFYLFIFKESLL